MNKFAGIKNYYCNLFFIVTGYSINCNSEDNIPRRKSINSSHALDWDQVVGQVFQWTDLQFGFSHIGRGDHINQVALSTNTKPFPKPIPEPFLKPFPETLPEPIPEPFPKPFLKPIPKVMEIRI